MHKMLSMRNSPPPEPVSFLTMHEGQEALKIPIQKRCTASLFWHCLCDLFVQMYLGPRLGSPWPHLGHISDKQHGAGCQPGLSAVLSPCWTKWKWQRDCKHCPYVPFQKTNNMAAKKDLILRKFTTVRLIMKLQDTFGKNFIPNRGSCFDIASKNIFIDSTLWRISNKQKKNSFILLPLLFWPHFLGHATKHLRTFQLVNPE